MSKRPRGLEEPPPTIFSFGFTSNKAPKAKPKDAELVRREAERRKLMKDPLDVLKQGM